MKIRSYAPSLLALGLLAGACATYDVKRPVLDKTTKADNTKVEASEQRGPVVEEAPKAVITPPVVKPESKPQTDEPAVPVVETPMPVAKPTPEQVEAIRDAVIEVGEAIKDLNPIQDQSNQVTPVTGPVPVATYEEAVAQIDKAKERDGNLKKYELAGGYDVLNGTRTQPCLEPTTLRTSVQALGETNDSYSVAHTYTDLYNKLENSFGVSVSGIFQIFSGGVGVQTKIMRETRMSSDDVVVLAGFTYLKERISLQGNGLAYSEYFADLSAKNRDLFRKQCGDRYVKDVTTGATMQLVFTAKKTDSSTWTKDQVEAAIRVGLSGILGFGTNVSTSNEQKQILNSYSFSTKCYTQGTSLGVCGAFSTDTTFNIGNDQGNVRSKVEEARRRVREEVQGGQYLTVLKETMLDYDVPLTACNRDSGNPCPSRWNYFTDYRDRLGKLKDYSLRRSEMEDICSKINFWQRRCSYVQNDLSNAINSCQNLAENCPGVHDYEQDVLRSCYNPGFIEMWNDSDYRKDYWRIEFKNMLNGGSFKPNTFYAFQDIGLRAAQDKVSSMKTFLNPHWTIKLYEHQKTERRGMDYILSGQRDIPFVGKSINDKFSSFEIVPGDDKP